MYEEFMKAQMIINNNYNEQFGMVVQQLRFLIDVIEDHEKDMMRMAEEINKLKAELSKGEES